jgi:NAD(P)-dependent dehydrogenase (short-subunit alcohol dehydrogenase family)
MDIEGKYALVLGAAGLVGAAVCRELLAWRPDTLIVASRQESRAQDMVGKLKAAFPSAETRIVAAWGDVFVRADWQTDSGHPRAQALSDPVRRRRLIGDILDPLDEEIIESSMLTQLIEGRAPRVGGTAAHIVIDCMNTATAVSYQNIYASAAHLRALAEGGSDEPGWAEELERLLASLYLPQLVRHVQLLAAAMERAGTEAYIKVGTTGTGGMGLNIPYTHGEEKPSRLLLSKAALAGAQSLLTFLMARTPGSLRIVKEVKPAAVIGWREIDYGPIRAGGSDIPLWDCLPEEAVSASDFSSLVNEGTFGTPTGETLRGTYIHTGENGQFTAGEFAAITSLGQMELVTPEEIARIVIAELMGGSTGRDIIAALDGAVMGPSYRGGFLRGAAISKLRQLEAEHGESVAFCILGPPRLSKLLFEAYLLKQVCATPDAILVPDADKLAADLADFVRDNPEIRRRIISIGIGILLGDGDRLLRGPKLKAQDAHGGWVDLTPENMQLWKGRIEALCALAHEEASGDTSSLFDRNLAASQEWRPEPGVLNIGEAVAWIFNNEDQGQRGKV